MVDYNVERQQKMAQNKAKSWASRPKAILRAKDKLIKVTSLRKGRLPIPNITALVNKCREIMCQHPLWEKDSVKLVYMAELLSSNHCWGSKTMSKGCSRPKHTKTIEQWNNVHFFNLLSVFRFIHLPPTSWHVVGFIKYTIFLSLSFSLCLSLSLSLSLSLYIHSRYHTITDIYTTALLLTKPSSDDDSVFRHSLRGEASLSITQSAQEVSHDTSSLCQIVVALWDCQIHVDAVTALSWIFSMYFILSVGGSLRLFKKTEVELAINPCIRPRGNTLVIKPHMTQCSRRSSYFSNFRWCAQSKFSSKGTVNSETKTFFL